MPNIKGYGVSDYTLLKQSQFTQIIAAHQRAVWTMLRRHSWLDQRYHMFDLHAGPGMDYQGIEGSPLVFLRQAHATGLPYRAVFYEKHPQRYLQLNRRVLALLTEGDLTGTVVVDPQPHQERLLVDIDRIRRFHAIGKSFGLVYADPTGAMPPFDLLGEANAEMPGLDVLLNISATAIKRVRQNVAVADKRPLNAWLDSVGKRDWFIRPCFGASQWTFLLGTNCLDPVVLRALGFVDVQSAKGQLLMRKINLTATERIAVAEAA